MILSLVVGCAGEDPADPPPRYAGCSYVAQATWDPIPETSNLELETYVLQGSYDDLGWEVESRMDASVDSDDLTQTWARRPDGTYDDWAQDWGNDGVIDLEEVWTYGDDDLAEQTEWYQGETRTGHVTYTNEGGLRVASDYESYGLEIHEEYTYDELDRLVAIDTFEERGKDPDRRYEVAYLGDTDSVASWARSEFDGPELERMDYEYDEHERALWWRYVDDTTGESEESSLAYLDGDELPEQYSIVYAQDSLPSLFIDGAVVRDLAGRSLLDTQRWSGPGLPGDLLARTAYTWVCP